MKSKTKRKRRERTLFEFPDPNLRADPAKTRRRAMLETRRSILKKLAVRISREDCFCSWNWTEPIRRCQAVRREKPGNAGVARPET